MPSALLLKVDESYSIVLCWDHVLHNQVLSLDGLSGDPLRTSPKSVFVTGVATSDATKVRSLMSLELVVAASGRLGVVGTAF